MDDFCTCITLARTDVGNVRLCRAGCVHLTYRRVTLHFESADAFEGLAELVAEEEAARRPDEGLSILYQWFAVDLDGDDTPAFAALVASAALAIGWTRGDLKFTDADFHRLVARPTPHPEAS
jgi:hypothetical protein